MHGLGAVVQAVVVLAGGCSSAAEVVLDRLLGVEDPSGGSNAAGPSAGSVGALLAVSASLAAVLQEITETAAVTYTDTLRPAAELVWQLAAGVSSLVAMMIVYLLLPVAKRLFAVTGRLLAGQHTTAAEGVAPAASETAAAAVLCIQPAEADDASGSSFAAAVIGHLLLTLLTCRSPVWQVQICSGSSNGPVAAGEQLQQMLEQQISRLLSSAEVTALCSSARAAAAAEDVIGQYMQVLLNCCFLSSSNSSQASHTDGSGSGDSGTARQPVNKLRGWMAAGLAQQEAESSAGGGAVEQQEPQQPVGQPRPARAVMVDPVVAGDGYTYERGAINRWLQSVSVSRSPMTNRMMHPHLVPNFALKSSILEWQQQQQQEAGGRRG
eukprot:gene6590-6818_t